MKKSTKSALLTTLMTLVVVGVYQACGGGSGRDGNNANNGDFTFFSTLSTLRLEVAYETGAEPFTGINTITGDQLWQILEDNMVALLQGKAAASNMTIPKSLGDMQQVAAEGQSGWTTTEILDFASRFRTLSSSRENGDFFVAFLNGNFESNGQIRTNVLGVSITGTNVIAIFKDVVEGSSTDVTKTTQKYVEQGTLVHEMGHALGLVNNGLPLTSNHHDSANGAHCSNDCIMSHVNEGPDLALFVADFINSGGTILFDNACLQDARSF